MLAVLMMSHSIVENVVKQGYLKKGNFGTSRLSGFFRRSEGNKWFVLTIRQGVPFLEYYDTDVDVFTQQPINSFNLSSCQNVKSMGNTNPPSFCIVCPERVIELVASSRTQMVEWVNEVEASLTRLGILKNEAVEHVYTVCPAVVRKPRTTKEASDENDTETSSSALPQTISTSDSSNSGELPSNFLPSRLSETIIPPQSPPSRHRNLSVKPSSRTPFPSRTSSSFHASSNPASMGRATPPPLPLRLFSQPGRPAVNMDTTEPVVSCTYGSSSFNPVTEGSNDSDFVSPEVIAELRQQHQNHTRMTNSTTLERYSETSSRASPVGLPKDINIVMNRSYFQVSSCASDRDLLQAPLEPTNATESTDSSPYLGDDDDDGTDSAFDLSPSFLDRMLTDSMTKTDEATENLYCAFPCQQEASDSGISNTCDNHSVVSKPTPVSRKLQSTVHLSSTDADSESQSVLNEYEDAVSVGNHSRLSSDQTYANMLSGDDVQDFCNNCDIERTHLKQHVIRNDYVTDNDDEKSHMATTSETKQALVKLVESCPSKDENENFYSPDCDMEPPTIPAPPIPVPSIHSTPVPTIPAPPTPVPTIPAPPTPVPTISAPPTSVPKIPDPPTPVPTIPAPSTPVSTITAPPIPVSPTPIPTTPVPPAPVPNTSTQSVPVPKMSAPPIPTTPVPIIPAPPVPTIPVPIIPAPPVPTTPVPTIPLPTILAPPIPAPPIPPRHNSLKVRCDSSKYVASQDSVTPASSSNSSSLPPSAFSAATAGKHRNFSYEHSLVPSLPLPRKTGANPDPSHTQASAFTSSNGPLDIPPMVPRRTSPYSFLTEQDQPPAIPSRNSQSFFIKRPQITGLSSKSCTDDTSGHKSLTSESQFANEEKPTETGATSLSRKMLLDRSHSLHTVVSLKQTQAEILATEISMPSVSVTLTQKAGHGIALVDWSNFPCVVGWNQKDFPSLHGKLHLGDLILSIDNISVTSSETALKLLKQAPSEKIEVIVHRMPYAKVFAIHRNAEGQDLGIKREGGTGEIVFVDPSGLAAQHGLTSQSQNSFGNGRCNWFLTEINNRPLSLFFKENEIDHRLLAVGREISLVVQPCDFIYEIRRQFKKFKNYKNFITQ